MLRLLSCIGTIVLTVVPAHAQNVLIADLRGANENPPVASPGGGSAIVIFDQAFQTMTVRTTFSDLTTPTVDAHIHCCAVPTANAVVAVGFRPAGFPLGVTAGEFNGTFNLTSAATYNGPFVTANGGTVTSARTAFLNGTQAELAYVNIHTTRFPGGEIRGQLVTTADLTPQAYTLLPEIPLQTAKLQQTTMRRYLSTVRGFSDELGQQTATMGADRQLGTFLVASGQFGKFDDDENRPQVDFGSTGVMGGLDYRIGNGSLVGVYAGYDSADARLTPNSRNSNVDSWYVGLYGSLGLGPAYLDLQASYGKSDYDLFRRISVGTFTAESVAETDSEQWLLSGTTGLNFQAGGFEVEPYLGVQYVSVDLDDFTETGNIAALTIGSRDVESLQSIVGLHVGIEIPVGGATLRPEVRGEWRHEFEDDDRGLIHGSFGGIAPFAFTGNPLGDDYAIVGAGFSLGARGPLSLMVNYTGQLGGDYQIHALTGGFSLEF